MVFFFSLFKTSFVSFPFKSIHFLVSSLLQILFKKNGNEMKFNHNACEISFTEYFLLFFFSLFFLFYSFAWRRRVKALQPRKIVFVLISKCDECCFARCFFFFNAANNLPLCLCVYFLIRSLLFFFRDKMLFDDISFSFDLLFKELNRIFFSRFCMDSKFSSFFYQLRFIYLFNQYRVVVCFPVRLLTRSVYCCLFVYQRLI